MGIDVTFVLTDTYKDWPKVRQLLKTASRTGFVRAHWLE